MSTEGDHQQSTALEGKVGLVATDDVQMCYRVFEVFKVFDLARS